MEGALVMKLRIRQLREEGAKEDFDLKPALRDYYDRHMTYGYGTVQITASDTDFYACPG